MRVTKRVLKWVVILEFVEEGEEGVTVDLEVADDPQVVSQKETGQVQVHGVADRMGVSPDGQNPL